MCIAGSVTDCSIAEIFQFIEKTKKTGLLTIRSFPDSKATPSNVHYIWVCNGKIVAAANRLDEQGLSSLISRCKWVSDRVLTKLLQWCCPTNQPLGVWLKNNRVLESQNLEQLFQIQLLQQVYPLFQLKEAQFQFDSKAFLPAREMTGLNIPATEATLMGLRVLQNQGILTEGLPDPQKALISIISNQPLCRLDALEWQVWEFTNGTVSLSAIAQQLRLPVKTIQQTALRLISVGLVQEVPLLVNPLSKPAFHFVPLYPL
ncbi:MULTISPECIES: DUF4388 domain-containing protein [unclassified Coleofasciculus]|uniref:DUF4388 domain-containing protein n=1 Tax=unclassified Coleofasciculus TaxID=2692782 RepID=UPI00187FCC29|nr:MULTISPECIES: DUF4388 domain-containing protein [unclassified Coleofasciculus]MBE9127844.1 DUF4388 domain-containing protein [Coleofasciculus sp. LEGE 07081]MBE9148088.1 DUF4388 domain-containing protein [Coleofasciculus sp. LEGE 07092]